MQEEPCQFDALKFTDVFEPARKSCIDVITLSAERIQRFVFPRAPVATETVEHQLNHVALAVIRRRHMGEDEQLHANF